MTGGRGKLSGVGQRMPVWFLPKFDPGDHTFLQNIPSGYAHQLDGQSFLNAPTAARRISWGRLKAGYR